MNGCDKRLAERGDKMGDVPAALVEVPCMHDLSSFPRREAAKDDSFACKNPSLTHPRSAPLPSHTLMRVGGREGSGGERRPVEHSPPRRQAADASFLPERGHNPFGKEPARTQYVADNSMHRAHAHVLCSIFPEMSSTCAFCACHPSSMSMAVSRRLAFERE